MSGPIVRTGTTPAFWSNWDKVFGGKQAGGAKKAAAKSAKAAKPAKSAKKKGAKSKKKS
jgi:hypothetical protein